MGSEEGNALLKLVRRGISQFPIWKKMKMRDFEEFGGRFLLFGAEWPWRVTGSCGIPLAVISLKSTIAGSKTTRERYYLMAC